MTNQSDNTNLSSNNGLSREAAVMSKPLDSGVPDHTVPTVRDALNDWEMDIRDIQTLAQMLHDYVSPGRAIDGTDHEAVCYIAARLGDIGKRLNESFEDVWEKSPK